MSSLRSRLFLFALDHRHLLNGHRRRPATIDRNTSIPALRQQAARGSHLYGTVPPDVTVETLSIGTMPVEWVRPKGAHAKRVILYFHGGGYVMGDCPSHRAIVAKFAKGSATNALLFGYRLAPEHPFPAALHDAIAAFDWLRHQGIQPADMVFMGDSAGGGLCLATLLALRKRGQPMPAAAVALSPWTDLSCSGPSYTANMTSEILAPKGSWTTFSAHYAAAHDLHDPLLSPLFGKLRGLPPLLLYVGGNEVLLDDSRVFAERAQAAGVTVTLRIGPGLFHCFPVCAPLFPEATRALSEICTFIRKATP